MMVFHRAVIVHGIADATAALGAGVPVTLLSAPGAALFAGCLWWRELVETARVSHPDTEALDILDCADASGLAMGALRSGVSRLILWRDAPGWQKVAVIAGEQGGVVLGERPPALDLARRGAARGLRTWLRSPG